MESGACVNDTKWWVLLTSWRLVIVQCELDQLGKLAGKPRGKKTGARARFNIRSQKQNAEIKGRDCLHRHHYNRKLAVIANLRANTSQHNSAVI